MATRVLPVAGAALVSLLLGGGDTLAARNCVSNLGSGRSARIKSLKVVGLTADGRLLCFPAKSADKAEVIGSVSGLGGGNTALIGIDFRVQDGQLYGVGNNGGVYTIDPNTAQATFVNQLTVPLDPTATSFAVDFNPAADRLRIVSDQGQNLRHNVNAGGTTATDAPRHHRRGQQRGHRPRGRPRPRIPTTTSPRAPAPRCTTWPRCRTRSSCSRRPTASPAASPPTWYPPAASASTPARRRPRHLQRRGQWRDGRQPRLRRPQRERRLRLLHRELPDRPGGAAGSLQRPGRRHRPSAQPELTRPRAAVVARVLRLARRPRQHTWQVFRLFLAPTRDGRRSSASRPDGRVLPADRPAGTQSATRPKRSTTVCARRRSGGAMRKSTSSIGSTRPR